MQNLKKIEGQRKDLAEVSLLEAKLDDMEFVLTSVIQAREATIRKLEQEIKDLKEQISSSSS